MTNEAQDANSLSLAVDRRDSAGRFGTDAHAAEVLVAELGAPA